MTGTGRIVAALALALAGTGLAIAGPAIAKDKSKGKPAEEKEAPPPKPVPIGSPASWIPPDGYPSAARDSAEEGRVAFTLEVDESGRVSDCKVTSSSGSPLLDETTCYYMSANARFTPARDAKNKIVPSKWSSAMTWKLEVKPVPTQVEASSTPGTAQSPPGHGKTK